MVFLSKFKCRKAITPRPFLPPPWQTIDDRVRGGSSTSSFEATANNGAIFSGHLDTSTLGGAGFASQFSPESKPNGTDGFWDLSAYDGILLQYRKGDGKLYTFIVKDEAKEEKREDGREKASLSWEFDFEGKEDGGEVWAKWPDFKPVYRGKEQNDTRDIKANEVRRLGFMMRR